MATLAMLQVAQPASWEGPVMAVSLAVIALVCLAAGTAVMLLALRLARQVEDVGETVVSLRGDVARTLKASRRVLRQGHDVLTVVRQETGALADTSRQLRRRVVRGADRVQEKLEDLEALYDVVHDEVQETALDVAAAMHTIRRGDGLIGRVRRMLVRGAR